MCIVVVMTVLLPNERSKGGYRKQACNTGNTHEEQLSTHVAAGAF